VPDGNYQIDLSFAAKEILFSDNAALGVEANASSGHISICNYYIG
jgi:hypothetical protein